mgnify:FL=1
MSNASSLDKGVHTEETVRLDHDDQSKSDHDIKIVKRKTMDTTLAFMEEHDSEVPEITPEQERKLYHKLLRRVFVMVFLINLFMFMDKNAMGFSKLLGMWKDTNLKQKEYNNTNTLFYVGYLIGQFPGHVLFQTFNKRYFMAVTLTCWLILMFTQLAAKDYAGIATIRFFLGLTESSVTPCIEHTLGMFFDSKTQSVLNPILWLGAVSVGIPTGFIAYGISHVKGSIHPWKLYWIINGSLTFLLSIWVVLDYPTNPAEYKAFTIEERVHIIRKIKRQNRSSIEEKKIKKYQFIEAIKDPVTWLFSLYALTSMLANNMNFQQQVISLSLGVSRINSTLITVAQSCYSCAFFLLGSFLMTKFKSSLCYLAVIFNIPAILGGFLAVFLPWKNKIGILASCIIVHTDGFAYILALCWSQISAAGYTKRLTRTAMFMIGYGIGDIIAPQMWVTGPRYYAAWGVQLGIAWFGSSLILLTIRYILAKRNNERVKDLTYDSDGNVIMKRYEYLESGSDAESGKRETDVSNFDLTDFENKEFIYPL